MQNHIDMRSSLSVVGAFFVTICSRLEMQNDFEPLCTIDMDSFVVFFAAFVM
jgi:hypothetical protein